MYLLLLNQAFITSTPIFLIKRFPRLYSKATFRFLSDMHQAPRPHTRSYQEYQETQHLLLFSQFCHSTALGSVPTSVAMLLLSVSSAQLSSFSVSSGLLKTRQHLAAFLHLHSLPTYALKAHIIPQFPNYSIMMHLCYD
jgi:hypothetical protein